MKFRIASLAIATTLLSGCMSTQLVPPPSDFVGNLPDEYKEKLNTLNDQPSTPFRGGVQTFQFDEAASLLTVVYRLPNPRWYWNTRKSEAEKDVFPYVCEQFGGVIDHGGLGGYATGMLAMVVLPRMLLQQKSVPSLSSLKTANYC